VGSGEGAHCSCAFLATLFPGSFIVRFVSLHVSEQAENVGLRDVFGFPLLIGLIWLRIQGLLEEHFGSFDGLSLSTSEEEAQDGVLCQLNFIQQLEGTDEAAKLFVEIGQLFLQEPSQGVVDGEEVVGLALRWALVPEGLEETAEVDQGLLLALGPFEVVP
jgi:hypothetical protein